jgi:hypothetical protein
MTTEDPLGLANKAKKKAETDFTNGLKDVQVKKGWAEYSSAQHHLFYELISREY